MGFGSAIFAAAQVVLDLIGREFAGDGSTEDIKQIMQSARSVCSKTTDLIGEIKALNRETKQKDLKDILGTLSKVCASALHYWLTEVARFSMIEQ